MQVSGDQGVWGNVKWQALHVRQRFERVVAFHLSTRGVEHYLPLRHTTNHSQYRKRDIELPMFPGYIFCKYSGKTDLSLFTIPGVIAVTGGAEPVAVSPEDEINNLKRVVDARLPIRPWPFTSGERTVMVKNGPLNGMTGVLSETPGKRFLIVSVRLISRSIAIEIDDSCELCPFAGTDEEHRLTGGDRHTISLPPQARQARAKVE